MTKEQNKRVDELFKKALKALDDKIADPTCDANPLENLNELEEILTDDLICNYARRQQNDCIKS